MKISPKTMWRERLKFLNNTGVRVNKLPNEQKKQPRYFKTPYEFCDISKVALEKSRKKNKNGCKKRNRGGVKASAVRANKLVNKEAKYLYRR